MTQGDIDLNRANLTREEAVSRSETLTVQDYHVAVDLTQARDLSQATFPVTTSIRFLTSQPGSTTFLDYLHGGIDRVRLNGKDLDLKASVGTARISLPDLAADNEVLIHGHSRYSTSGEGMHRFQDPQTEEIYLYTQYEPADARRVFPNFEQPDLKATFAFQLTGPRTWTLASNQPEVSREGVGDIVTVTFGETPPQSSYITTLLAGPYSRWTQHWQGHHASGAAALEMNIYARSSIADDVDAERIFETTAEGLDFFHDQFGVAYPWGSKYDQAFVPEYNLGAMENPGLVTFTEDFIYTSQATQAQYQSRANTLMHEMAHMWFGNLVTMRWWDDLWLKESFADYMGALAVDRATDFDGAWTTFANRRKAWAYVQDQYPTTHPIVADITDLESAQQNFDGITYAKGASVLKQLVAYVGETAFNEAARTYFERYRWGNATLADFLVVLTETSGREMSTWAGIWLETAGVSELRMDASSDPSVQQLSANPRGGQSPLRPHVLKVGRYELDASQRLVIMEQTQLELDDERDRTPVPGISADASRPRLLLINDEDLTYAKIRLDDRSLETVLNYPLTDQLSAATVWAALWNAVRDAYLPAEDFIGAVCRVGKSLTDVGLHAGVLNQAVTGIERFVPAERRHTVAERLGEALLGALETIGDGTDRQRSVARALVRLSGVTGQFHDELTILLGSAETTRSSGLAPGLRIDVEIRWLILIALAAHGHVSQQRLDTELQRDISASTRLWHRTASSARPDRGNRREAWRAVLSGHTSNGEVLSNAMLSATAEGALASQRQLIGDLENEYWSHLEQLWQDRSIGLATRTIRGLFPIHRDAIDGDAQAQQHHPTLVAATTWLGDHPQAPHTLRRLIIEFTDELRRGLRAQVMARG